MQECQGLAAEVLQNPWPSAGIVRAGLVLRRFERRLCIPCVYAHRRQAIGFAMEPRAGRSRRPRAPRVLGAALQRPLAAPIPRPGPDPIAVPPHQDRYLFQGHVQSGLLIHGCSIRFPLLRKPGRKTYADHERQPRSRHSIGKRRFAAMTGAGWAQCNYRMSDPRGIPRTPRAGAVRAMRET